MNLWIFNYSQFTVQNMRECGFWLNHILPFKHRIIDSVLTREHVSQWKPVFSHISCSDSRKPIKSELSEYSCMWGYIRIFSVFYVFEAYPSYKFDPISKFGHLFSKNPRCAESTDASIKLRTYQKPIDTWWRQVRTDLILAELNRFHLRLILSTPLLCK